MSTSSNILERIRMLIARRDEPEYIRALVSVVWVMALGIGVTALVIVFVFEVNVYMTISEDINTAPSTSIKPAVAAGEVDRLQEIAGVLQARAAASLPAVQGTTTARDSYQSR